MKNVRDFLRCVREHMPVLDEPFLRPSVCKRKPVPYRFIQGRESKGLDVPHFQLKFAQHVPKTAPTVLVFPQNKTEFGPLGIRSTVANDVYREWPRFEQGWTFSFATVISMANFGYMYYYHNHQCIWKMNRVQIIMITIIIISIIIITITNILRFVRQ